MSLCVSNGKKVNWFVCTHVRQINGKTYTWKSSLTYEFHNHNLNVALTYQWKSGLLIKVSTRGVTKVYFLLWYYITTKYHLQMANAISNFKNDNGILTHFGSIHFKSVLYERTYFNKTVQKETWHRLLNNKQSLKTWLVLCRLKEANEAIETDRHNIYYMTFNSQKPCKQRI